MKILKFNDFSGVEYRKGSTKFGGLVTKLMEFLRIHKPKEGNSLEFDIEEFENESNIKIQEIEELLADENKNNLINFDIDIINGKIVFSNLKSDKNRFFESID